MVCYGWVRGLIGSIRWHERALVAEIDLLDPSKIERYRQELRDEEAPEPEPLEAQELYDVWRQGNRRRPVPPKLSDRHKANLVDLRRRGITFAAKMGRRDRNGLIDCTIFNDIPADCLAGALHDCTSYPDNCITPHHMRLQKGPKRLWCEFRVKS